jgi:membrane protein implicated in regulation of membrane protease activity
MTLGTNEQDQTPPRSLTRSSKRDVFIYGFAGAMLALVFVIGLPAADTWYKILGICVIAIMAVLYVARAITVLRRDDRATSPENNDLPGHGTEM